ncbi:MAG TPA: hypothetical protein VHW71_01825 [Steroidobacteraceae bacterium]|jgi:hypothetical protein|nr:hypothetical protein [Steroidobacteraceae bacterium]
MEVLLWIVGGIVALIAGMWLVQTLTGTAISLRTAGRFYLSAELKKWNIRQHVPDGCVFEIADEVTEFYAEMRERAGWSVLQTKTEILKPLERDARVIQEWCRGRDIAGPSIKYIPDALKKHGVPLGVLKVQSPQ